MRTLLVAVLVSLILASPGTAQMMRGTVRDAQTAALLSGAFVTLSSEDGLVRMSALSDTLGRVFIQPATSGTYTVRIERIGYQTATHEVSLTSLDPVDLAVAMTVNPLRLQEVAVSRGRRCTASPAAARETAVVWEEARKALSVAAWLETDADAQFAVRIAEEVLTLRREPLQYPVLQFDSINDRMSFRSESADVLHDEGFARFTPERSDYHGPDAQLLVSPRFVAEHCFSIERRRDRAGLIGLAFEPLPENRLPDIRGVLWIDEQSGALQFIEYDYVNLPIRVRREYAGGRVNVRQLGNGAFVVDSYRITMPLLLPDDRGRSLDVRRLHERSGEVLDISFGGERIELVSRFTVRGVVFDSLHGRPLANARLTVPGTSFSTITDSVGRFTLENVPRGRYAVGVEDTAFARRPQPYALGFRVDSADVDVIIGLPSRIGLLRALCSNDPNLQAAGRRLKEAPERLGVLQFHLLNPDGTPWLTRDYSVQLSFTAPPIGIDDNGASVQARYQLDGSGVLTACGIPIGQPIEVRFARDDQPQMQMTVQIPRDGFIRAALMRN